MKKQYAPYWTWEDFQNQMYTTEKQDESIIKKCVALLSDPDLFQSKAIEMIQKYKVSALVNISNTQMNRLAWIGQATCNFCFLANELTVRVAWSELTDSERYEANRVAKNIIINYEAEHRKLHTPVEKDGIQKRNTGRSSDKDLPVEKSPLLQIDMFSDSE